MQLQIDAQDKQGPIRLSLEVDNQFAVGGRWLRGTFHCHVGDIDEPSVVCDHYRRLGFDFLGSSDYNRVTAMPASTGGLITLQGAEVFHPAQTDLLHVICTGLHRDVAPLNGRLDDVARLAGDAHDQGGLAILAHPFWSDLTWSDLTTLCGTGITGFEVSNRLSWRINGKGRADQLWQMLLGAGHRLAAIGADDANGWDDDVIGRTWTGVLATEATPEGVLDAVRARRTYASEGPRLEAVAFGDDVVRVRASPCIACHFMSGGFGARTVRVAEPVERFELSLVDDGYRLTDRLCVCLEDERGRRAWSSAIEMKVRTSRR